MMPHVHFEFLTVKHDHYCFFLLVGI